MLFQLAWLAAGLVLVTAGADLLVRGAGVLARLAGITPLVIGLTVVAFGTSAPEMAVSVKSALAGQPDVALGNVVGSNIFNVLGILGLAALVLPLAVSRQLIRFDVPIMIGVSGLLWLLALDGNVSRVEGVCLFAGIVVYTGWLIWQARREKKGSGPDEFETEYGQPETGGAAAVVRGLLFVAVGLVLLVFGARWMVDAAVAISRQLGVSELVIGLTIVAIGTSLPELATSIVAAIKGERDIAIGNVVGSNIFNILSVLGVSAAIAPGGVNVARSALSLDIPVMVGTAAVCLPFFITGGRLSRGEGILFVIGYVGYIVALWLNATGRFG